ncbi:MerR family transcriptional regulator [Actinoplanes sp. CA-142083]|uniref:MerR family transcriptional regulator n=1 Tax=Actinoplanes sp. CA-142083 TaxID=3239903 RepID=UPI003D8E5183
MEYSIGELAARFGLATHVLRHWEDVGVLEPERRVAGRRVYDDTHVARVAEIQLCKAAGFSLEDIRDLDDPALRRAKLESQLAQVRERLTQLELSAKMLEHGLRCRHRDHRACPRFQEMVLSRVDGVAVAKAMDHD